MDNRLNILLITVIIAFINIHGQINRTLHLVVDINRLRFSEMDSTWFNDRDSIWIADESVFYRFDPRFLVQEFLTCDQQTERPATCHVKMNVDDNQVTIRTLNEFDTMMQKFLIQPIKSDTCLNNPCKEKTSSFPAMELSRKEQNDGGWAVVYGAFGALIGLSAFAIVESIESRLNHHSYNWNIPILAGCGTGLITAGASYFTMDRVDTFIAINIHFKI